MKELYKITGFRMSLHDVNFIEIAAYPETALPLCAAIHKDRGEYEKCLSCDSDAFIEVKKTKKPFIYKCRFGLTEAISPLYNFGILTGFLMMGQVGDEFLDYKKLRAMLEALKMDEHEIDAILKDMHTTTLDMTRTYLKIMTICAQYLTLSNAMPGERLSVAEAAWKYIGENYDKKISIKDICTKAGCSKSTLITAFKKEFGLTLGEAITNIRLEEAKKLLLTEDTSISDIAQRTGFYDQSYFSKVFSAKYNTTPSDFKRKGFL